MAKVQSPKKLRDHNITPEYNSHRGNRSQRDSIISRRDLTKKNQPVPSYIPNGLPREEPAELPRLFIQGTGGSIKIDLGGLGIKLSPESFAFTMPDESLGGLHIHAGDIAMVQPMGAVLRDGNLLLVQDGPQQIIRRLIKRGKLWFLEAVDRNGVTACPLLDQGIGGVVLGFVRLFEEVKPVPYRKTDSFFAVPRERSFPADRAANRRHKAAKKLIRAKPSYRMHKKSPVFLAAEKRSARICEVAQACPHPR